MSPADLGGLLAPWSVETFLAEYWERCPLAIHRGQPSAYSDLVSIDDFDQIVSATPVDWWHEGDPAVTASSASDGVTERHPLRTDLHRRPSLPAVHDALATGHSLVVRHLRRTWPAISALCGSVEETLQHPVSCNLFLSPPDGAAYAPHYDNSDTFFLQLWGSKTWRLHPPASELPLAAGVASPVDEAGSPATTVRLAQGDLLFLPRGWIHSGSAGPDGSLHATLGTSPVRWLDVAVELLRVAATSDRRLRQAVPLWCGKSRVPATEHALELLRTCVPGAGEDPLTRVLAAVLEDHPAPLATATSPVFADPVDLDAVLRRQPGLEPVVVVEGTSARISFAGSFVEGPAATAPALRFVADRATFTPRELPELADPHQLALARQLVRQGLVSRSATEP